MQLSALQKNLDDESKRQAAANLKIQTLTEDLEFLKKQHKSALEEVREHKVDMATYAKQINDEYQTKIRLRMADMRARYEAQLSSGMATLDNLYKSQLNNELKCAKAAHDDVVLMRVRINELESGSSHDALVDSLQREIAALKADVDAARKTFQESLDGKDLHIAELNCEVERVFGDICCLTEEKVDVDFDLNTYRILMEDFESRCSSGGGGQSCENSALLQ